MNTLKSMHIEVWSDNGRGMLSIRGDAHESAKPGLSYLWFLMFEREFRDIVSGRMTSAQDGYHKLDTMGDRWTFFDMQVPVRSHGEMTIPYINLEVPLFVQQTLLRMCERIWSAGSGIKGATQKVTIHLTLQMRNRWIRKYGQGKGSVRWVVDADTQTRIDAHKSDAKFTSCIQHIEQIARNRTEGWFDTASVHMGKDLDGYWWSCVSPNGNRVMTGGLVNHSRDESTFDWSLHT